MSRRWWALATVALGVAIIIVDATVVNVALPSIIKDLGLTSTQAEWMNAIYSLVFAALLLTVGKIGDLYGRRLVFLIGITIFTAASVMAAMSVEAAGLIIARLIQGVGAAMILPATLSTVNAVFQGRERAIAFAVWGSTIGGMAAVGPLLGGWLTTYHSWHWIFWINLPIGAVIVAGIVLAVPETKDEHSQPGLDLVGAALSAMALAAIVFALIEGQRYGWLQEKDGDPSPVPFAMVLGLLLMAVFVAHQRARRKAGKVVLVDLGLLGVKSFRYGSIAALIVALGEFGLLFTLPLLLQNALGYSALGTGWLIMALALGTFFISGASPRMVARLGSRAVVRIGLAVEALAVAGLALSLSATISGGFIAAWLFLYGVGVGLATAQLTSVILADIPVEESGQASGLQSTFRQLGSALGVAILGTLLFTTLGDASEREMVAAGIPAEVIEQSVPAVTVSAGGVIPTLLENPQTAAVGEAAANGLITASRITSGIGSLIILLGLAATWALPHQRTAEHAARVVESDGGPPR